jgi:ACS family hexuronate transporter-like MFS transporter
MVAAPLLAQACSARWGWRSAFYIAGALGFLWVPLWLGVSRRVPVAGRESSTAPRAPIAAILRDTRYWGLITANLLLMSAYTLWVNWTTLYLVAAHGLTQAEANLRLAWLPPIFATLGGFAGGWLSLRWTPRAGLVNARLRVIGVGVALLACGVVIPWLPSAGWAAAGISLSFFACVLASVNVYALPIDLFGPERAAFTVSGLTSVYGLLQGVFGSLAGRVIDAHGYTPVLLAAALLPVAAYAVLSATVRHR